MDNSVNLQLSGNCLLSCLSSVHFAMYQRIKDLQKEIDSLTEKRESRENRYKRTAQMLQLMSKRNVEKAKKIEELEAQLMELKGVVAEPIFEDVDQLRSERDDHQTSRTSDPLADKMIHEGKAMANVTNAHYLNSIDEDLPFPDSPSELTYTIVVKNQEPILDNPEEMMDNINPGPTDEVLSHYLSNEAKSIPMVNVSTVFEELEDHEENCPLGEPEALITDDPLSDRGSGNYESPLDHQIIKPTTSMKRRNESISDNSSKMKKEKPKHKAAQSQSCHSKDKVLDEQTATDEVSINSSSTSKHAKVNPTIEKPTTSIKSIDNPSKTKKEKPKHKAAQSQSCHSKDNVLDEQTTTEVFTNSPSTSKNAGLKSTHVKQAPHEKKFFKSNTFQRKEPTVFGNSLKSMKKTKKITQNRRSRQKDTATRLFDELFGVTIDQHADPKNATSPRYLRSMCKKNEMGECNGKCTECAESNYDFLTAIDDDEPVSNLSYISVKKNESSGNN